MTQAWDFVDAAILWATEDDADTVQHVQSQFLRRTITDVDWGKLYNARIRSACQNFQKLRAGTGGYYHAPIRTVADLVAANRYELMGMANLGSKSREAIRSVLRQHHLHLDGDER